MNHGLGFQDSTRLHFSKSKSDFPFSSLLGSDSRLKHSQPSSLSLSLSLSLSSYKLVFSKCSPFSLLSSLSSDFKISLFSFFYYYFLFWNKQSPLLLYNKIILVSSLHWVASCCYCCLTPHLTPPPHFVSTFHHGSSQPLRLGFLVSDQLKFPPFSSLFFCILCLWYGFIILFKCFFFW